MSILEQCRTCRNKLCQCRNCDRTEEKIKKCGCNIDEQDPCIGYKFGTPPPNNKNKEIKYPSPIEGSSFSIEVTNETFKNF